MGDAAIKPKIWTREEYDCMISKGIFGPGERVELLAGEIFSMAPQGAGHVTAVSLAAEALRAAFGPGFYIRVHSPIALDDLSEPEPDVAVVPGGPRDYAADHPAAPLLVVEVSDSSWTHDRRRKWSRYAANRLPEYWILDLARRVLEVHREPAKVRGSLFKWGYRESLKLGPDDVVSPLARPTATIRVADLLP